MGKKQIVYKLLTQQQKHLRDGKQKKTNLVKQPTIDCVLIPIYRSGVKHSVGKVIPLMSLGRQEKPRKLGRSTPKDTSNSNG